MAPQVSPGSPEADLRPTQDAAADAAANAGADAAPAPAPKRHSKIILIGAALAAVGVVGFVVLRKKKTAPRSA
jgi:hypothetical protein